MDTSADREARWAPALFVLLWSTGFVGARFGLPYAEPFTFLFFRYALVTLLLGSVLLAIRRPFPGSPRQWLHLAIAGLLLHGVYIGGVFVAIARGTSAGVAALIVGVQPLLTAALAGVVLGERVTRGQALGFAFGFAGLALTVSRTLGQGELPLSGLLSCVIALFAITFGTLHQKRHLGGVDVFGGACVQYLVTAVAFGVLALAFETRAVEWHPRFIFALGWLCVVLSLGAVSLLWRLIQRGAAARVASLFYLVPPVTALEGYFLFGESLTRMQVAGIAVTALGVAIINRG